MTQGILNQKITIKDFSYNKSKRIINSTQMETPIGTMFAYAVDQGICLLEFTDRKMLDRQFNVLSKLLNASILQSPNKHFEILNQQLNEYFEGKRKEYSVPLIIPGTEFQQSVWGGLQRIPYGSTLSYKQQSLALNKPEAIRAVAHANGMNRIAIVIPCHRVIGSDGQLTGYSGGEWRKRWLIDLEQANK